jgi:hypothetical protein
MRTETLMPYEAGRTKPRLIVVKPAEPVSASPERPSLPVMPPLYPEGGEEAYFAALAPEMQQWIKNKQTPDEAQVPQIPSVVETAAQRQWNADYAAYQEYNLRYGGPDVQAYARSRMPRGDIFAARPDTVVFSRRKSPPVTEDVFAAAADE